MSRRGRGKQNWLAKAFSTGPNSRLYDGALTHTHPLKTPTPPPHIGDRGNLKEHDNPLTDMIPSGICTERIGHQLIRGVLAIHGGCITFFSQRIIYRGVRLKSFLLEPMTFILETFQNWRLKLAKTPLDSKSAAYWHERVLFRCFFYLAKVSY